MEVGGLGNTNSVINGRLKSFCSLSNNVHLAIESGRKGIVVLQSLTAVY
jgi:hypothetical protein